MRCGTRLVTDGMEDFRVRERCGEPFWTDHFNNVEVLGAYGPVERQRSVEFLFGGRQIAPEKASPTGGDPTANVGIEDRGAALEVFRRLCWRAGKHPS